MRHEYAIMTKHSMVDASWLKCKRKNTIKGKVVKVKLQMISGWPVLAKSKGNTMSVPGGK